MKALVLAIQLLTLVRLNPRLEPTPALIAHSRRWFALVGAGLGAVVALVATAARAVLPPAPAGVLAIALWEGLSRFLHLDGLMDTADGLIPPVEGPRAIEIMRDSRVGAFGVAAAVIVLGFKFAAMSALLEAARGWAVVGVAAAARASAAIMAGITGPAPARQGLGAAVAGPAKGALALNAAVAALALAPWGPRGLAAAACALAAGILLGRRFKARLGGITGDCLGATIEIVEAVGLGAMAWAGP